MANKRIQDLEQTTDLTNDDLIPLDTTKKTFATTLKSLSEWLKNTFQTKDNLEQALSDATDKYPSSKVLKDESSRTMSIMDTKVNKSGDTMSGSLFFENQPSNESRIEFKNPDFDASNRVKTMNIGRIRFLDKNNFQIGQIYMDYDKNIDLYRLGIKSNGFIEVQNQKYPKSALNTDSYGNNWVRLGNGIQICWGNIGNREQQITFPQAFKDTHYIITATSTNIENNTSASVIRTDTKKTTGIKTFCGLSQYWIAIGYWY